MIAPALNSSVQSRIALEIFDSILDQIPSVLLVDNFKSKPIAPQATARVTGFAMAVPIAAFCAITVFVKNVRTAPPKNQNGELEA